MINQTNEIQRIHDWNDRVGNVSTKRALHEPEVTMYYNLIREEFQELVDAYIQGDVTEVKDALADLYVVIGGMSHMMGYNMNDLLKVVNDSNYSKFVDPSNQQQVDATLDSYFDDPRYTNVYVRDDGVVWGEVVETGSKKVLKGVNYQPPQWDVVIPLDDISTKTGE